MLFEFINVSSDLELGFGPKVCLICLNITITGGGGGRTQSMPMATRFLPDGHGQKWAYMGVHVFYHKQGSWRVNLNSLPCNDNIL